jgi:hypothetical protein
VPGAGAGAGEGEVVQETMLKSRRITTHTIIKKKNLNQMSEDELAAQLDDLIKNESMQDFCFARGKVGVCTCMHIKNQKLKLIHFFLSGISMPLKQELFIAQKHQLMSLHTSYGTRYQMMAVMPTP